ncbi:MAG TPA: hypothetical protein VHF27_08985 [Acidimicrobiales bacterium]|nr:hypothetical protein [Acidimicrobiales bacterium]
MPWTESRSRDEWLAEVRRRGERIRRRRQLAASALGAVALLGPAFAMVSYTTGGDGQRQLQVAASGPAPTSGVAGPSLPAMVGEGEAIPTTTALAGADALPEVTAPSGPLYSTTTTEVHRRVSSINGVPSYDDPVIRPTPPTTAAENDSVRSTVLPPPTPTTAPPGDSALSACPTGEVKVTVTTEKGTYARGEAVRWSSTLENRSSTTCLMSGRAFFHVEDTAGTIVGSFPYTADYMLPVKAEPGKVITNTGGWDQKDCSGPACTHVTPGTYVVVAKWTEGGPWVGRETFEIGA